MSKSKYKKFTGRIGWNHLVTPDEYLGEKKWKMGFYPDDLQAIKDMGNRSKVRSTEDGTYIDLTRSVEKEFKGELTKFDPPKITLNGEEFDGKYIPRGSRIEVDLCFYNAGKFGTGTRIQSVKILELAEEDEPKTENQKVEAAEEPSTKTRNKDIPF